MKRRASLLGALVMVLMMVMASAASAGEVKGPPGPDGATGGPTPIADFWTGGGAASICSFSGLNDVIDEEEPTLTQSYGIFLVHFQNEFGLTTQEVKQLLPSPGEACNPSKMGNPKK
jgi:hypothetical protein